MDDKYFIAIGTKVRSMINPDLTGTVAGYSVLHSQPRYGLPSRQTPVAIIDLDHGFWSSDEKVYVSAFVSHPSNITVIEHDDLPK
jgi:hypothetical protein